jgi:hypothetical protein
MLVETYLKDSILDPLLNYMILRLLVGTKLSGSVTSIAIGKIMALTASHALVVIRYDA